MARTKYRVEVVIYRIENSGTENEEADLEYEEDLQEFAKYTDAHTYAEKIRVDHNPQPGDLMK